MNVVLYRVHSNLKEFHIKHAVNEWCFIQSSLNFKRVSYKARCKLMLFYTEFTQI